MAEPLVTHRPGEPFPTYQLVYVSTATDGLSDLEFQALAAQSQRNNLLLGISELLIYADGLFMQFLEGSRRNVSGLYQVIRTDPRHHDVYAMRRQFIPARQFDGWSMRPATPGELSRRGNAVHSKLFDLDEDFVATHPFAIESWGLLSEFCASATA